MEENFIRIEHVDRLDLVDVPRECICTYPYRPLYSGDFKRAIEVRFTDGAARLFVAQRAWRWPFHIRLATAFLILIGRRPKEERSNKTLQPTCYADIAAFERGEVDA